jgi:hypothetical protein
MLRTRLLTRVPGFVSSSVVLASPCEVRWLLLGGYALGLTGCNRCLGWARSQGQRQSSRLRGVLLYVLSVRYRRCHAVQGQPRRQDQCYRDQHGDELSERRHSSVHQNNRLSILNDVCLGDRPILESDEEKKRTRQDEPGLPAFCSAHEFLTELVGLNARSLPSLPWASDPRMRMPC